MADKKVNLHEGHRQRMKNRFLKHGADSFDDYQMLEILLFYAIPTKDTNELAHILINTFGSIDKVLQADYEELMEVKGIGENVASLLKFIPLIAKRYINSTFTSNGVILLNNAAKMKEYCISLFVGEEKKESVYALALNSDLTLISQMKLNTGIVSKVLIPLRTLAEFLFKCNCSRVVLTHNHPNGTASASRSDIDATINVADFLSSMDVELVDHIIVSRGRSNSMRENNIASEAWEMMNG